MNDWMLGIVCLIVAASCFAIIEWMINEDDREYLEREEEFKRELESHWHGKRK